MSTRIKAIRIETTGGPDVLNLVERDLPDPGPGEVQIRHAAMGLNYIDTYHRTGLYPLDLPSGLGLEAAGTVAAVGEGVTGFDLGDRVAYGTGPVGAYAEAANIPAGQVVKVPTGISLETAAAMMLKGMTAQYLLRQTFRVKPGQIILVHAAAGGVGLLLCQWAKHLGATVIGTVGSEAKAELAKSHGCDHSILYRSEDVVARVRELTKGQGVPVVYDSVGKDTWEMSLDCLALKGMMVSYGNASGPVGLIDPLILSQKGSLFLTRPTLFHYTATREALEASANDLFQAAEDGALRVAINQTYPLAEAARAHTELEARKTSGASLLIP